VDVQVITSAGVEAAWGVCPRRGAGQDRVRVVETATAVVVALADGAGGTGGGAEAAQAIVDAVAELAVRDASARPTWAEAIEALDRDPRLGGGQATAVIAEVGGDGAVGASAGDSQAWLVGADGVYVLTASQERKPLVGSGAAATPFGCALESATLVIATDGLFAYARREDLVRIAEGDDLAAAARALVELVRLPGGDLPDDVAIVLCRAAR
jgi:serine/threonine protein phosphatase PrpC